MRITESKLRQLIRSIINEELDHLSISKKIDINGDGEGEVPVGVCEVSPGGRHFFHGNKMFPCDPKGESKWWQYMTKDGKSTIGKSGPFLGQGKPVSGEQIKNGQDYLKVTSPDSLIAYSRGGVVAQLVGSLPSEVIYLAPAWGRGYGAEADQIKGNGTIYHGAGDYFVPLKNSIKAAAASGMSLFVHPTQNHFSILTKWRDGQPPMGEYVQMSAEQIQQALLSPDEGGIEDWGPEEYLKKSDPRFQQQLTWAHENIFSSESNESIIRRMIHNLLLEKKAVKCPQKNGKRDYKCEYQKYGGASKKGKTDRNARNQARRQAKRTGKVKKGDGKEIDHIKPLSKGGSSAKSNQRIVSRSTNRKKGSK